MSDNGVLGPPELVNRRTVLDREHRLAPVERQSFRPQPEGTKHLPPDALQALFNVEQSEFGGIFLDANGNCGCTSSGSSCGKCFSNCYASFANPVTK